MQKQLELCRLLRKITGQRGVEIVVVLHDINLAAHFTDHVVVFDQHGRLYGAGTSRELITETMLREVYGVIASVNINVNGISAVFPIASVREEI